MSLPRAFFFFSFFFFFYHFGRAKYKTNMGIGRRGVVVGREIGNEISLVQSEGREGRGSTV